jgi:hypothetical protein
MQCWGKWRRIGPIGECPNPGLSSSIEKDHKNKPNLVRKIKSHSHISNFPIYNCSALGVADVRPHIVVSVYGLNFKGLLDSGADCTVLGEQGLHLVEQLNLSAQVTRGIIKKQPDVVTGSKDKTERWTKVICADAQ